MENQHQLIRGYRDLDANEIDLINEIKAAEARIGTLYQRVAEHLALQRDRAGADKQRIAAAEPARWLAMARSDLQIGFMKLTRSVAQPVSVL